MEGKCSRGYLWSNEVSHVRLPKRGMVVDVIYGLILQILAVAAAAGWCEHSTAGHRICKL